MTENATARTRVSQKNPGFLIEDLGVLRAVGLMPAEGAMAVAVPNPFYLAAGEALPRVEIFIQGTSVPCPEHS
jgi:hypothetical protein